MKKLLDSVVVAIGAREDTTVALSPPCQTITVVSAGERRHLGRVVASLAGDKKMLDSSVATADAREDTTTTGE